MYSSTKPPPIKSKNKSKKSPAKKKEDHEIKDIKVDNSLKEGIESVLNIAANIQSSKTAPSTPSRAARFPLGRETKKTFSLEALPLEFDTPKTTRIRYGHTVLKR